jgi:hypothetical protein
MQYLLMCCFEEKRWDALPQGERDSIMQRYGVWIEELAKSGCYLAGGKLQPSSSATTVRSKNSKAAVTDGPFAETKEQLGGYHILECDDLDQAITHAQRIPTVAAGGTIEVRPLAFRTP